MKNGRSSEKKKKHCDPSDPKDKTKGDQWDHTAIDVESRLVVSMVVGKRTSEKTKELIEDFSERTGNVPPALITTDDCNNYTGVLLEQYGETVISENTDKLDRPRDRDKKWPKGSVYATVNKSYRKGKVSETKRTIVYGTEKALSDALKASSCSNNINTSFVERQNGTDRNYNSRKVRKTLEFSKDIIVHILVSWWVMFCYNFHHTHAGLRQLKSDGSFVHRTPAMAAGLEQRPLTVAEIMTTQVVGFIPSSKPGLDVVGVHVAPGPAP